MTDKKKITVIDVARMSGVSKGTVDRVLHNRGGVSVASKRRVEEVIASLGYHPNLYASMLALKKMYVVVCLIPEFGQGDYWQLAGEGISKAEKMAEEYNVQLVSVLYDQYDLESFRSACRRVLDMAPSAVMVAPMFREETQHFASSLASRSIPYVYIDSRLEDSDYLAYYGMPMHRSGYLAASLLVGDLQPTEVAVFRIDRGGERRADPTHDRREGFMDYMGEHLPQTIVYNTFIQPLDERENERIFDRFFAQHPDVRHIITFNSRVHLIASYLKAHQQQHFKVVGFDIIDSNVALLEEGYVDMLVAQRTQMQVYAGIQAIIDYLITRKLPAVKDNYMSLDIVTRYNVDYYLNIIKQ